MVTFQKIDGDVEASSAGVQEGSIVSGQINKGEILVIGGFPVKVHLKC